MPNWTQPVCVIHWNEHHAVKPAADGVSHLGKPMVLPEHLDVDGAGELELCCYGGGQTRAGLYVRIDPATVPFPAP